MKNCQLALQHKPGTELASGKRQKRGAPRRAISGRDGGRNRTSNCRVIARGDNGWRVVSMFQRVIAHMDIAQRGFILRCWRHRHGFLERRYHKHRAHNQQSAGASVARSVRGTLAPAAWRMLWVFSMPLRRAHATRTLLTAFAAVRAQRTARRGLSLHVVIMFS